MLNLDRGRFKEGGVGSGKEGEVKEAKAERVVRREEGGGLRDEEEGGPFWEESDDIDKGTVQGGFKFLGHL